MRAEINSVGVLILIPESRTEDWAVAEWHRQSRIDVDDVVRAQKFHISGASVRIEFSHLDQVKPDISAEEWAKTVGQGYPKSNWKIGGE